MVVFIDMLTDDLHGAETNAAWNGFTRARGYADVQRAIKYMLQIITGSVD
jgi:hypothetical protein